MIMKQKVFNAFKQILEQVHIKLIKLECNND